MNPGFLELKTAQQLFAKLEDDFKIASHASTDSRAWFNFFVTAEHLPEWHFKNQRLASEFRSQHAVLRVCSHIANGGSYFEVNRHNAIASTNITYVVGYGQDGRLLQAQGTPSQGERAFTLQLSPEEAKELGAEILVSELANQILTLYRKTLAVIGQE